MNCMGSAGDGEGRYDSRHGSLCRMRFFSESGNAGSMALNRRALMHCGEWMISSYGIRSKSPSTHPLIQPLTFTCLNV